MIRQLASIASKESANLSQDEEDGSAVDSGIFFSERLISRIGNTQVDGYALGLWTTGLGAGGVVTPSLREL